MKRDRFESNAVRAAFVSLALLAAPLFGCGDKAEPATPGADAKPVAEPPAPVEEKRPVILATTTSTVDTGLLEALVPVFEKRSGFQVKTVAAGSGEALAMGRKGAADVLLVHAPAAEEKLMADGFGARRLAVMHNEFFLVGPPDDPAGAKVAAAAEALRRIAEKKAVFVSRGDDSGTHKKEKALWEAAGVKPEGAWYVEAGQGMGATLTIANEKRGYTLTDSGTFYSMKSIDLAVAVQGDPELANPYHVIEVKSEGANADGARAFADFLVGAEGQALIAKFEKGGHTLFTPDASR
jgi:tungstate transport system substrate-binding protein